MKNIIQILFFCFGLGLTNVNGSSLTICSTCDFQTFPSAFEASQHGDTLLILGGKHKIKNIEIDKSITIIGKDNAELISRDGNEILTVTANNVEIRGLIFSGVQTSYLKEYSAIRVRRVRDFHIHHNTINECFFGIYLERVKEGIVSHNNIHGKLKTEAESGNAIHAWYSDSLYIASNEISGHRDGIYLEFVHYSKMVDNYSHDNMRYGLHFMFSNDDTYSENRFENNGVGVAVMFSRRIIMNKNRFTDNWGRSSYGLLLKEIFDGEIYDNAFNNNTIGIFVEGSNRIKYHNNTFYSNGWAIKFSGGCESNEIYKNDFLYNSLDLIVSTQLNDNIIHSNYWSDYTGYDLDRNGIGDIPYYPVKLFSYVLNEVPESIVLMRSLFIDILNYSEKVSPILTPKEVADKLPAMQQINSHLN
ncbi:MAG: nitrous oxide reductase family maturation protein NosD [Saprospiraceae bacterium]|nr:nitrous oxide reductase family maturation protein NosD [Saprospiraceae bacterium]